MGDVRMKTWQAWLLFGLLALTWGSSFILMKRGLQSFSYWQIGYLRIASAWIFTIFIAYRYWRKWRGKNWWALLGVGLFGNGIPYLLFPLAVNHLDSSLVGVLNSLVPLFTLLIGLLWFGIRVPWLSALGIALGFAGAFWLLAPGLQLQNKSLYYGLFPILATLCYAISINLINGKLKEERPMAITLYSLSTVGPVCLFLLLRTDFVAVMQDDSRAWLNAFYVILLGVMGSSLAILIFNYLIKGTSPLFAASVTYAIPIVALLWGLFDGESVGLHHLGGMMAILAGVYLVNRKGKTRLALRLRGKRAN